MRQTTEHRRSFYMHFSFLLFLHFPVRDGPAFLSCAARLVIQESVDTQRTTADFRCSPDVIHPIGGPKGFSQVIFDFETTYSDSLPLHPTLGYVDTFNVGIAEAKVRSVVFNSGQCKNSKLVRYDVLRIFSHWRFHQ